MVQNIERSRQASFPASAPAANAVFYRTYSRRGSGPDATRETWGQMCDRTLTGLVKLGQLSKSEAALVGQMQQQLKAMPSGRWLWVGGTAWLEKPENFSGAYNCTSTNVIDWQAFGLMMDLAMMGCGTGAVLEHKYINLIPCPRNRINVTTHGDIGTVSAEQREENTEVTVDGHNVSIRVGDSRQGWVSSYQALLELSTDERFDGEVSVTVDLSHVRPAGEKLKGFGGVANPVRLPRLYQRCANILNKAQGRKLTSVECCLLIDEAAACVVAGNIRRSAGMRQFSSDDEQAAQAKENLWGQDADGNWRIDPERDVLRMANHTRVFHHKPSLEECQAAVRKQYYSGEGAIQWAGEAIARANADLLRSPEEKSEFLKRYESSPEAAQAYLQELASSSAAPLAADEVKHRTERYGLNPCVTADTWVHTEHGARQVKDLVGVQHGTYINGELFSTTESGFFHSGNKPVVKLTTQEGYELRLTENHRLLKVTSQTQKAQYTQWVEAGTLQQGDRVLIHNHRGIQPWEGEGSEEEGWLLGNLIGDGCLSDSAENFSHQALLRYWGESQREMSEHAVALLQKADLYVGQRIVEHKQNGYFQISSAKLRQLADSYGIVRGQKTITSAVESASYAFYQGFLRGLFDADGSVQGQQQHGVSIRLAQSNLDLLKAAQRMLLRLGIASTIYQERRAAGERLLPNSQRELQRYACKAQHELIISNDNIQVFSALIGFMDVEKAQRLESLMNSYRRKPNRDRFAVRISHIEPDGIEPVYDCTIPGPARFDANGFVAHNCGEIIGADFHCNLAEVHLNQLDPSNPDEQEAAFKAGALSVAALLNHRFQEPRYRKSREWDPIVGVSFTGLFDFFVHAFGVEWLQWWAAGRPDTMSGLAFKQREKDYLNRWRDVVHATVWDYCDRHGIKRPNRCTTVQPAGTKSLLTGASSGWHPPKAQRFIRRITFGKNDPVALACIDYGYSVVPAQSDKDEQGRLLDDPFDPRCTEWLVEIPTAVSWANLPGADEIDISQFSALAQFDFYSQVQQHYTTHNTSATIELREPEIEPLAAAIHRAIETDAGYMSAALLARFDDHQTFPRLPFEPVDKAQYEKLMREVSERRSVDDFYTALTRYDLGERLEAGPAGCDSDKCMLPEARPDV
ncbi:MAG: ribonucleoside-triphosphate reductase, adenosylcobalamin-dependent [Elainellaceae cyanobacterium]